MMRLSEGQYSMNLEAVYETENSIYLVLELLCGGEIFKMRNGALHPRDAQHIAHQLLTAIQNLRANKVMHRDLKPSNILFKHKGVPIRKNEIKLADFGLSAKFTKDTELLFKRCGTPGFIAPEVINFDKVNDSADMCHNCDIYSAGAIIFFMLTGRLPFEGKDYKEVLKKNENGVIDWNLPEVQELDNNTIEFLKSMLETDQNERITPTEALKHPYFFNYRNQTETHEKKFMKFLSKDTASSAQQKPELNKKDTGKNSNVDILDELFSGSDIPEEHQEDGPMKLIAHLGEQSLSYKLSPFIEKRPLAKNSGSEKDTNDTLGHRVTPHKLIRKMSKFSQEAKKQVTTSGPNSPLF
jgi:serine/threonine protein kinase